MREPAPGPLRPRLPRPTAHDAVAGLGVALVLLPQAVAYAVLAGMPPAAGLAVAAVSTIAAAPFVSSPYLQTGPVAITALLTFGTLSATAEPGSERYVALAALLALLVGVVRLVIGGSRSGVIAYLLSQPVLAGFTSAAAIVIAISQLPAVLGLDAGGRGPGDVLPALVDVTAWDADTLAVAVATAVTMVLTARVHRLFPSVLTAVGAGVATALLVGFDGAVVGAVPAGLPGLVLDLPFGEAPGLLVAAVVIALVGFAEPAAISRTYARDAGEAWDADREFVSQGVANLAAGLVGGFPVGGSFGRSAVARSAGATSGWAGAVAGLAVLVASPFLGGVIGQLPRAVLGAIILVSVARLAVPRDLWALRHLSRQQFAIGVVTFVLTLVLAPSIHVAVGVGVALSVGAHLRREVAVASPSWIEGATLHVRPLGVLFFGSAHRLEEQLGDVVAAHHELERVVFHMDRLGRVDVTGALALQVVLDALHARGLRTDVVDLTPTASTIVRRVLDHDAYGVDLDVPPATAAMPGQLGGGGLPAPTGTGR